MTYPALECYGHLHLHLRPPHDPSVLTCRTTRTIIVTRCGKVALSLEPYTPGYLLKRRAVASAAVVAQRSTGGGGCQAQVDRRGHWPCRQEGIQQVEQRVPPGTERGVDLLPQGTERVYRVYRANYRQTHRGMVPHRGPAAPPLPHHHSWRVKS